MFEEVRSNSGFGLGIVTSYKEYRSRTFGILRAFAVWGLSPNQALHINPAPPRE